MDSKKICIDTSFWISLLYKNDVLHDDARLKFQSLGLDKTIIIVNNFVIEEVTTVLTYKGFIKIVPYFYKLLDSLNVVYSRLSIDDYKIFFLKLNKRISFADSSLILDSFRYNANLLTFDDQQYNIYRAI